MLEREGKTRRCNCRVAYHELERLTNARGTRCLRLFEAVASYLFKISDCKQTAAASSSASTADDISIEPNNPSYGNFATCCQRWYRILESAACELRWCPWYVASFVFWHPMMTVVIQVGSGLV